MKESVWWGQKVLTSSYWFPFSNCLKPMNQSLAADNHVLDEISVVFYFFSAGLANGAYVTVTEHKLLS